MIRITMLGAIAAALLAAGCDKAPEGAKQAAAPAAPAPIRFEPGQWEATSELVKMEVPGLPPELAKANLGQKTSFKHCMTPEQAEKPQADFFTNNDKTTDCTTKSFAMAGGRIDSVMSCTDRNSKTAMEMTIKGDYQPTAYTATMTMVTKSPTGEGEMRMTANTSGKRIGACEAGAAKAG